MTGRDPPEPAGPALNLHAGIVVVGEAGVLIRGSSGSGKSAFAHRLIRAAARAGSFARLVADDRALVAVRHGRLVARPVPLIEGQLELRGIGLARIPSEAAAVIRLVVDLETEPSGRLPSPSERVIELLGVSLARIRLLGPDNVDVALWLLCGGNDTLMTIP